MLKNSTFWMGMTAIFTGVAAAAALITTLISYQSIRFQEDLAKQTTASIQIVGNSTEIKCPDVARTGTVVAGTADLVRDEKLWLILHSPGEARLYLLGSREVSVQDGEWRLPIEVLGGKADAGATFDLYAVAADANATSALYDEVLQAEDFSPKVASLPVGAYVVDSQCVTRS